MKLKYLTLLTASFFFAYTGCGTAQKEKPHKAAMTIPDGGAVSNPLNFEKDFIDKFKPAALPYEADAVLTPLDTMPAHLAIELILEPAAQAQSGTFGDFWGTEDIKKETKEALQNRFINADKNIFRVLNFGFGQRIQLSEDFYSLIFKIVPTEMEGSYSYTYLANYTKAGKFIDAVQIGGVAGYVDFESKWESRVKREGTIDLQTTTIKRGGMEDGSQDFTEYATIQYGLEPEGKWVILQEKYTGFSGDFKNPTTQECVYIEEFGNGDVQIARQLPKQDREQLIVTQLDKSKNLIIAQTESGKEMTFTFDLDKKSITCAQNGKNSNFVRARN
ncbi:MAG: hypothetical protein MUE85_14565 [Microscillaceae bacterium]|jgi:hypothetical protein|nr:hypothetical protein [Microscillaceae bacterium]